MMIVMFFAGTAVGLAVYDVIEVEYAIAAVFGLLIVGGVNSFLLVRAEHPNVAPSDPWVGPIDF